MTTELRISSGDGTIHARLPEGHEGAGLGGASKILAEVSEGTSGISRAGEGADAASPRQSVAKQER
jgi:hypothetical protein